MPILTWLKDQVFQEHAHSFKNIPEIAPIALHEPYESHVYPKLGPQEKCLLIYYWNRIRGIDSIQSIAKSLDLDPQEVYEIITHLAGEFNLKELLRRIQAYAQKTRELRIHGDIEKNTQRLGKIPVQQEADTAETRKIRKRRDVTADF